jgi:hypothetical protein
MRIHAGRAKVVAQISKSAVSPICNRQALETEACNEFRPSPQSLSVFICVHLWFKRVIQSCDP